MPENNPDPAPVRPRFAWTRKNKLITAAVAAVLVIGGGTAIGVTTYNANTRAQCQEVATAYADGYEALRTAHDRATASITGATDTEGVEHITGFVSTEEQQASDGYEPSEGDTLTAAVTTALEDGALPADATAACSTRDEVASINAQAETMTGQATAITDASSALDEAVYAYQTVQMIAEAQKSLTDAVTAGDEAVSAAQSAVDTANAGEGYLAGFADSDEGKQLIADVQAKLDVATGLDTDVTGESREDVEKITARVQPVTDATATLTEATKKLTDALDAYKATKQADAEAAAAAQAQAQRSQSSNGSGSTSSSSSSSSNRGSSSSPSGSNSGSSNSSGSSSSGSSGSTGGSSSGGSGTPSTCTEGRVVNRTIGDKTVTVKCVGGSWVDVP